MSRLPIGEEVTFLIPHPVASLKNRKRIFGSGARKIILPSKQAVADTAEIKRVAEAASGGRMFHPDDSLRIEYEHDLRTDEVLVRVTKVGELPTKGKRGTKRDVHGMLETIADALQGVLYPNDSAIDEFSGKRQRP